MLSLILQSRDDLHLRSVSVEWHVEAGNEAQCSSDVTSSGSAPSLGRFADARVLPDLERIAQEDEDGDVRRAVQRAIEQIRQRGDTGADIGEK